MGWRPVAVRRAAPALFPIVDHDAHTAALGALHGLFDGEQQVGTAAA